MSAMNQYTQKSLEAIQRAQRIAVEYQHMQVDEEHLASALLDEESSLIPQLLGKCGVSVSSLKAAVEDALARIPRVSGPGREADKVYITQELDKALNEADARAKQMKDEYISVEHLWMGLAAKPNARMKDILGKAGFDLDRFLQALSEVRGATRVTSDTPE